MSFSLSKIFLVGANLSQSNYFIIGLHLVSMLKKETRKPMKTEDQIPVPAFWAKLIPYIMESKIPESRIITPQTRSFLKIRIVKGTATFPQTISYGSGALETTISDSELVI